jgi:hypothetical protein
MMQEFFARFHALSQAQDYVLSDQLSERKPKQKQAPTIQGEPHKNCESRLPLIHHRIDISDPIFESKSHQYCAVSISNDAGNRVGWGQS